MKRRKRTGYVAAKIRASTARRNGELPLRLPTARAMHRAAREYDVRLEGEPHSYGFYDADGGYVGEIDISLKGVRYSRFGYEQDGTAHWMPGAWGASVSSEVIIGIAQGLMAGFTFAASVDEFGDGILTTRPTGPAKSAKGRTARKNGNLQWLDYPRAPLLYTTFAREDLVLDKVGTNSFNVYENGEWSGNITVSMAGITARDIGPRGSGTAQWVFPEVQEKGKAFAANHLTYVVLALLMDYPFKSAVEGYSGGLLRVSR